MIEQAYYELDSGRVDPTKDLKFTQRLKLHHHEYKDHVRTGVLAKLLGKDKGDLVYWYETFTEEYNKSQQCCRRKEDYSVKPENINLDKYKNLLLDRLKDTLKITGFNIDDLRLHLSHETTTIISRNGS